MYLPTFWKLTTEAMMYRAKHIAGWTVPTTIFLVWLSKDSIYNWVFSTIIPPPRGVQKQDNWAQWRKQFPTADSFRLLWRSFSKASIQQEIKQYLN